MLMTWDDLRFFLAIQRGGSLAGAARALGVDGTTVGRRLTALEERLATRLFDRRPDGFVPTAAAERILPKVLGLEQALADIEREVQGLDERAEGVVRVALGELVACLLLPRHLAAFRERHPKLRLELRVGGGVADILRSEADIGLRTVPPSDRSLVRRQIATIAYALVASGAYLARHGTPTSLDDLRHHDLVGLDPSLERSVESRWWNTHVDEPSYAVRTNSTSAVLAFAEAGLGLALVPSAFARSRPSLVMLDVGVPLPSTPLWLVVHQDMRRTTRIRAVIEAIEQMVAAEGL